MGGGEEENVDLSGLEDSAIDGTLVVAADERTVEDAFDGRRLRPGLRVTGGGICSIWDDGVPARFRDGVVALSGTATGAVAVYAAEASVES